MKVIGITGQIGAGKTTVINYLKSKGYTCLLEDEIAREIKTRSDIRKKLNKHFGKEISDSEILEEVSKDFTHLVFLNNLIHPLVYEYVENYIKDFKGKEKTKSDIQNNHDIVCQNKDANNYIFIESALPCEARFDKLCDKVIIIMSDYEIRLTRVMDSRNISQQDFDLLDSRQEKTLGDFMIDNESLCSVVMNDGSIGELIDKLDL